ncbi:MAG: hypothetical protein AW10_01943 [Candidatus Accumulibacter appositus]|uniref:Uncharacterized protein n=1 Tax=Candidatus Accumulibacter appositus TaxID=1454003 RepID=A0A011NXV5_9PROT|nr:heme-binding protein [Accumulibacter sp.]EXI80166.1 MAG: hypothetical protein AW10_01943 [Candidatus Accumulibacter appositus]HRF03613.1 heme-binding protein [Accumulibacter sp.]
MKKADLEKRFSEGRMIEKADSATQPSRLGSTGDGKFSLIELLRGTWTSEAQGWNLIALPFSSAPDKFRLLMNQYGETLSFNAPDKGVPNRGVTPDSMGTTPDPSDETDQLIDAIAYEQIITQKEVEDFPVSTMREKNGNPIHHEPGFFLQFLNHISIGHTEEDGEEDGPKEQLKIARLATIPHGNSVLAMGTVQFVDGPPMIRDENALPERINNMDVGGNPYLAPYQHFENNHFFGNVPQTVADFPGFFPTDANAILKFANTKIRVKRTTVLHFDTKFRNEQLTGVPISNIPFVTREADATEVHATFWIMELVKEDDSDPTEFIMQYSQTVYLEFFDSDVPGKRIRWPHVSINTLRKT